MAEAHARTIDAAEALAGVTADTVRVVGGGSQNALLCAGCRRPELAAQSCPVEPTATFGDK
ncbi:hypothetical protein BLSMQ_3513 [Brevibacterium aurantiacum]|uniref:Carbohydrate kinase FGGY C-terminal domain-containing protein n=1 Tax=Brevibacterium aurantiacum TaxID=273384 RepID=A0A1D7W836_BREAU|nr:hypothetical protein BLSMQ_3513 [Brevibacterium aurantiacum]